MQPKRHSKRVLVTGGGTLLGDNIAAALLAEGAEVTLLVRPGTEERLGILAERVRWHVADLWDPASLRGRARGHGVLIHTVGSIIADPARGLTHQRLNFVSARNAVNLTINDGVPHIVLLSAARAPWMHRAYVRAKREAESYIGRVGVSATVIRAPLFYVRRQPRAPFYALMTLLGSLPPLAWTHLGRVAPMPLDVLARGVARLALDTQRSRALYYAPDLRRLVKRDERRGKPFAALQVTTSPQEVARPFDLLDEDTPFGWMPPDDRS